MTTFFSPGNLPAAKVVGEGVSSAYAQFSGVDEGTISDVYPALSRARRDAFGIAVLGVVGRGESAGDVDEQFSIMSIAKPFVLATVCSALGVDRTRDQVGVNATGLAFNSLDAVPAAPDGRTNPMVNPGAIATASMIPGASQEDRWRCVADSLSCFAGRQLSVDEEVLESSLASNHRNRQIAAQLAEAGRLAITAQDAVDLYTHACALAVTTRDLATMGATLASGGVNPTTGERVVDPRVCRHVLAAMATAGMYERSGDWLWDVGLPGKSGISGGILTVAPGKGALATWSPPLDSAGNSVRGILAAEKLAFELGMDVFAVPPG
jgi:glutaminase